MTSGSSMRVRESDESFWKRTGALFIARGLRPTVVVFVIQSAALAVVSALPLQGGEQQLYTQSAKATLALIASLPPALRVLYIFSHNLIAASSELIPALGQLVFLYSTYATARGAEALAPTYGLSGPAYVGLLFLLPHSWLELPAYALTGVEGYFLTRTVIWERERFRTELTQAVFVSLLAVAFLFVAAVFEVSEGLLGFPDVYLAWISFAVLAVAVYLALSKIRGFGSAPHESV